MIISAEFKTLLVSQDPEILLTASQNLLNTEDQKMTKEIL